MNSVNDKFSELLPWYVNSTIGAEDRAWVESHLEANPDARAELDWYRSLQTRVQETAPAVPATIGLARVMHLIRGDRPTLAERVRAFFFGDAGLRPAFALAGLALVAVQAGFIFNLTREAQDDTAEMRARHLTPVAEGPLLKLNIAPDTKEADLRHLLMSVQGSLAGGPGQLGDYYVRVPAGKEAAALEQLRASPIVQAVTLAPGLPPRE